MNDKVQSLIKLAERFARKLSLAQLISDDPRAIVSDAFFGPQQEGNFQHFILKPNSHFSQALPESIKSVDIGAVIDTKSHTANFLVSTNPNTPQLHNTLINALKEDYKASYGKYPAERLTDRLARNDVRPATIQQSVPSIIHIS